MLSESDIIDHKIIRTLCEHVDGLSCWEISKLAKIGDQKVRHHLNALLEKKIIKKIKRMYFFPHQIFIKDGVIIAKLPEGFIIFSCPHFGVDCNCSGVVTDECKYLKSLPKPMKKMLEKNYH